MADDTAIVATVDRVRPDLIVNCAAYTTWTAPRIIPSDALAINGVCGPDARPPGDGARRGARPLQHRLSCSTAWGRGPYTEDAQRIHAARTPRPNCSVSGLRPTPLAPTFLRVESLFGRAPGGPRSKGSVAGILHTLASGGAPRVFEDRTCRRPTSSTRRGDAAGRGIARPAVSITAELRTGDVVGVCARDRAAAGCRAARRSDADCAISRCAPRVPSTACCRTASSHRSASRCRRGRMRWRGTSPAGRPSGESLSSRRARSGCVAEEPFQGRARPSALFCLLGLSTAYRFSETIRAHQLADREARGQPGDSMPAA